MGIAGPFSAFDAAWPDRPRARFPRRGFAGNIDGGAVRVVYDPELDATVLVFANSSERGALDPFVVRTIRAIRAA